MSVLLVLLLNLSALTDQPAPNASPQPVRSVTAQIQRVDCHRNRAELPHVRKESGVSTGHKQKPAKQAIGSAQRQHHL